MADPSRIGQGFNVLAPVYDWCVKLVFGSRVDALQKAAIQALSPTEDCLIIGGGTGKILRYALDHNLANRYVYAELSTKMISRTKDRLTNQELANVKFTTDCNSEKTRYDVIILPFVLDCYSELQVSETIDNLKMKLAQNATVLVIDFNEETLNGFSPSWVQKVFLKFLYLFFQFGAGLETNKLPPLIKLFRAKEFKLYQHQVDYGGWLVATFWRLN